MSKGLMKMSDRIARAKRLGKAKLAAALERQQKRLEAGDVVMRDEQAAKLAAQGLSIMHPVAPEKPMPQSEKPTPQPEGQTRVELPTERDYIGMSPSVAPPQTPPTEPTQPADPAVRLLTGGLDGAEKDALAILLEMSLSELLAIPVFRQNAPPVAPDLARLWAQYGAAVVSKRMKGPISPEWGLLGASIAIFATRLDMSKFQQRKKVATPTPVVEP